MRLQKNNFSFSRLLLAALLLCLFISCSNKKQSIIIWTDRPEFALYAEIFNVDSPHQVSIVYKENLPNAFPVSSDEKRPDLVIGSWLESMDLKKNFAPINYLLTENNIAASKFYNNLLNIGLYNEKFYLLPISFNLPCIVFDSSYSEKLSNDYTITLDEINEHSKEFNQKNKSGIYTKMGFGPSWDADFLYMASKMNEVSFFEKDKTITWNQEKLDATVEYIKKWTADSNGSTSNEEDFKFKYLYTPKAKWISDGKTMFTYETSNNFFVISNSKNENVDFRWLSNDLIIPLEDEIVTVGVYKKSNNKKNAQSFLLWFFSEYNQKVILDSIKKMNLVSSSFGIAGGFSSIKAVNESVFPGFYPVLLGNLPNEKQIASANKLPANWESLKERVIKPYLINASSTQEEIEVQTMDALVTEWKKQYF